MPSSAARRSGQMPQRFAARYPSTRIPMVCVVDPCLDDYREWATQTEAGGCQFKLVGTAEEALRLARREAIDLWVVNVELPGLSGCALCEMLKVHDGCSPVYIVANQYSADAERAAWEAGATLFGCKPGQQAWLDEWLRRNARPTRRAPRRQTASRPNC